MNKKYPNNLKQLRIARGMSQMQVVQALGLKSKNRLSRWENGVALPNAVNIVKLCRICKANIEELY